MNLPFKEVNRVVGTISRIDLRLYSGGTRAPEIHVIEKYATGGGGGGRLICTAPLNEEKDISAFVEIFQKEASGVLSSDYVESPDTDKKIREAKDKAFAHVVENRIS